MMGIVGIVAQELVTHKTFADQAYDCDFNPFGDGRGFFQDVNKLDWPHETFQLGSLLRLLGAIEFRRV